MSIKSGQPDEKPTDRENLVCWNKDPQARALRVEADGRTFVFPFTHLVFVVHDSSRDAEELRVSLTTHDIRLQGRHLRELTLAFQKLAVDWIRAIPARFATLCDPEATMIERIEVTELQGEASSEAAE